jgi:hypothetical protein
MNSNEIIERLRIATARRFKVFVFGSVELEELHAVGRYDGIFRSNYWYVVLHPRVNPEHSYYTLNHAICGQTCPMTYDLPSNWRE